MSTNVSADSITNAIIAALGVLVAVPSVPLTTAVPLRSVARYVGEEFKDAESFRRGIAGRSPAVRVRFAGSRSIRRTISRTRDRVETVFGIICATDSHRVPGGRDALMGAIELIRNTIAARHFGLRINSMRFVRIDPFREDEQMLAYTMVFSTRHFTDYSICVTDEFKSYSGGIGFPTDDGSPITPIVEMAETFSEET
jgi:hypothetical protein